MSVTSIVAPRLDLVSMSAEFIEAVLGGRRAEAEAIGGFALDPAFPDGGALERLALRLEHMRRDAASQPWLLRAMVRRDDRAMVGYVNFHGPPTDGAAELGYTVLAPFRRMGFASEAALALMGWAATSYGVSRFIVSIAPDNLPSLRMAEKLGFRQIGSQIDEKDGLELVFELSW